MLEKGVHILWNVLFSNNNVPYTLLPTRINDFGGSFPNKHVAWHQHIITYRVCWNISYKHDPDVIQKKVGTEFCKYPFQLCETPFSMDHPIYMCNAHTFTFETCNIHRKQRTTPHAFCVINNFWLGKASKWISNMFTGHIKLILNEMNLYWTREKVFSPRRQT